MANEFQEIFVFTITFSDIIANMLVALACGIMIALLYKYTYKGLNYSAAFTVSIIMLTMITAIVIMVIGNNLARAFGLVGAMSIIRFRTAVKDASDIMFIFFALAIGLASGVKLHSIAIFGTIMVGLVYFIIVRFNFALPKNREFLIQVTAQSSGLPDAPFYDVFNKHCRRTKVVNVKTIGEEENEMMEFSYYIRLKDENNSKTLISDMKQVSGVSHVNLFFDEAE